MMKKSISEKYQKYIICILLSGAELYAVYGPDLSQDESDKLLLDENLNILLFQNVKKIPEYIEKNRKNLDLFDEENLSKWIHLNEDFTSYCFFNFDLVSAILKKRDIEYIDFENNTRIILDFLNLFKDYYYQIESNEFDAILKKTNLNVFLDFAYDGYPWKTKYESLEEKFKELKDKVCTPDILHDILLMYNYFIKRCRIL